VNDSTFHREVRSAVQCVLYAVDNGIDNETGRKWLGMAERRIALAGDAMQDGNEAEAAVYFNLLGMAESLGNLARPFAREN
jgi:hypothetical protein